MRAAPVLTSIIVLTSLALAGCVGTGPLPTTAAAASDAEAGGSGSTMNHTVEIVGWNARWSPGEVTVTVHFNGTVTDGGEPVAYRRVVGVVNVTAARYWSCVGGCPQPTVDRWGVYETESFADGNFSTEASAEFNASFVPPVTEPYCNGIRIWAWGKAGSWQNRSAPDDTDVVDWTEVCTQSYP